DNFTLVQLGQFDQLQVDFPNGRKIVFYNLYLQSSNFLKSLQNVETTPATIALKRIGRIGHQLQLAEHELRNYDHTVKKAGLGNVGNAAIDDHAGVKNFVALLRLLFAAEDTAQR